MSTVAPNSFDYVRLTDMSGIVWCVFDPVETATMNGVPLSSAFLNSVVDDRPTVLRLDEWSSFQLIGSTVGDILNAVSDYVYIRDVAETYQRLNGKVMFVGVDTDGTLRLKIDMSSATASASNDG
jgi:hypothetical protein